MAYESHRFDLLVTASEIKAAISKLFAEQGITIVEFPTFEKESYDCIAVPTNSIEKDEIREFLEQLQFECPTTLRTRTINCIRGRKFNNKEELLNTTKDEILKWRRFGKAAYIAITEALKKAGYSASFPIFNEK